MPPRPACSNRLAVLAALLALAGPAMAEDVVQPVRYGDVAEPDAELAAFIEGLRADIARGKDGLAAVEARMAPKVVLFSRSLDPLDPWRRLEAVKADRLERVASLIVEQGDVVMADGSQPPKPDLRPDALALIGDMIRKGRPLGTMAAFKGALCAPAAYKFDAAAARAFAKGRDSSGASLFFFTRDMALLSAARKGAAVKATVPAATLMLTDYEKDLAEGWTRYVAANGMEGYMKTRQDQLFLSQMHVCFARGPSGWAIAAIFGYGL